MFHKPAQLIRTGARAISANSAKCAVGSIDVAKRNDYYQNLLKAQNEETKPAGWDEAKPYEAIPGPKPLPLIGNVFRFLPPAGEYYNVPLQNFYKMLRDKYGEIVNVKGIIGRKPMTFVFNPDDIENMLRNAGPFPVRYGMESFIYYRTHLRPQIFGEVGGVLTVQGEEWFKFRSVVNPILMQPRTAQLFVTSMDNVANDLLKNIAHFSQQNENHEMPEDFLNELYKWALESMGVIALDRRLGCLNLDFEKDSDPQKLIQHITEMFEISYKLDVLPPIWKKITTPTWKRYVQIMDFITDTTMKYIEEGMSKPIDENKPDHELSVLQRLAKIDKRIALAMTMDMLIAGIDTTGRTIGAALYFLARNPEKQKEFRKEVLNLLPNKDSPVTKEILQDAPYLKAVIKETTRIAPIAVGNLRTAQKDLVLGGYQIPKGTEVIAMNMLAAQSDEFLETEKFIPERWLRTTEDDYSFKNAHQFAFLPFGFGARSCVGKRLANLELEVSLLKIIRNFELSWPHEDMKFSAKFLYGIDQPLKLHVKPLDK